MTEFQEIFDSFLQKITNYDEYINFTDEELTTELTMFMKKSLAKFMNAKNITPDYMMETFNRELTQLEIEIISSGMLCEYLTAKIYSIDLLKQSLSSKDFQLYSQANHIKELREVKSMCDKDFHYWQSRYGLSSFIKDGGK